jgi:hypothetical protein
MESEEVDQLKKEAISRLKKDIKNELKSTFVETPDEWREKMNASNSVIEAIDKNILTYNYNEFCKKIIDITESVLESSIDYNKLFITKMEYKKIIDRSKNNEEKEVLKELQYKFIKNVHTILAKNYFIESVKHKLGDKFYGIESEMNKSIKISIKKLDKKISNKK